MTDPLRRAFLAFGLLGLAACSSLEEEAQPTIDSLHTDEMEAAIQAAQPGKPAEAPPAKGM